MTALEIKDTKDFMNHLFLRDTFEFMRLMEAVIVKSYTVTLEGKKNDPSAETDEQSGQVSSAKREEPEYLSYSLLRPLLLDHIRGSETPYLIRIVLLLPAEEFFRLDQNVSADEAVSDFLLNIRFDGHRVLCVTGVNYRSFSLNRDPEKEWDAYVRRYLSDKGIVFE